MRKRILNINIWKKERETKAVIVMVLHEISGKTHKHMHTYLICFFFKEKEINRFVSWLSFFCIQKVTLKRKRKIKYQMYDMWTKIKFSSVDLVFDATFKRYDTKKRHLLNETENIIFQVYRELTCVIITTTIKNRNRTKISVCVVFSFFFIDKKFYQKIILLRIRQIAKCVLNKTKQ